MTATRAAASSPAFDPSLYPRVYRIPPRQRIVLLLIGVVLLALGAAMVWYAGLGHDPGVPPRWILGAALSFMFIVLGLYQIGDVLRYRVVLYPDAIERTNLFGTRRLARADICSRRMENQERHIPKLVLIPCRKHQKKLKLQLVLKQDAAFDAWMASISDLDVARTVEDMKAVLTDLALGATPEQRLDTLKTKRRTERIFTITVLIIAGWGFLDPRPYWLVLTLLAILPWLAMLLMARWRRLYGFRGENEFHPDLFVPLMLPGCVLGLRAVLDVQVLVGWLPFLPAAVIAVLMALCIRAVYADRKTSLWLYLLICIPVMSFYGYGSVVLANKLLDHAPPKTYLTFVYDRSVSRISKHIERDLRLGPWGPRKAPENVEVPRRVFDAVRVDDSVCVMLHPGAFRIAWFEVEPCG